MYTFLSSMSHVYAVKLIVLKEVIHEENVQSRGKEFVGKRENENTINVFLNPNYLIFFCKLRVFFQLEGGLGHFTVMSLQACMFQS